MQVVVQILGSFAEAVPALSADQYPTLNEAVVEFNSVFDDLEGFLGRDNDEPSGREKAALVDACSAPNKAILGRALEAAHAKLREYYGGMWAGVYAVALIMDPRFRTAYLEATHWEKEWVDEGKEAVLKAMQPHRADKPQPDEDGEASEGSDGGEGGSCGSCSGKARMRKQDARLHRGARKHQVRQEEGELARYLLEPTAPGNADVLGWWRRRAEDYPHLGRVARDYLAIPATSVPSERAFSTGADLITKKRGSLGEDTVRACMRFRGV